MPALLLCYDAWRELTTFLRWPGIGGLPMTEETTNRIYEWSLGDNDPEWIVLMSFYERYRASLGWPTEATLADVVKFAKHLLDNLADFKAELAEFKANWEDIPPPK